MAVGRHRSRQVGSVREPNVTDGTVWPGWPRDVRRGGRRGGHRRAGRRAASSPRRAATCSLLEGSPRIGGKLRLRRRRRGHRRRRRRGDARPPARGRRPGRIAGRRGRPPGDGHLAHLVPRRAAPDAALGDGGARSTSTQLAGTGVLSDAGLARRPHARPTTDVRRRRLRRRPRRRPPRRRGRRPAGRAPARWRLRRPRAQLSAAAAVPQLLALARPRASLLEQAAAVPALRRARSSPASPAAWAGCPA